MGGADADHQRYGQGHDVLHDVLDLRAEALNQVVAHLKYQLVVDLHGQVNRVLRQGLDVGVHLNHRLLDDVGGAALHRGVDGCPLGRARLRALAVDALNVDAIAQEGGDVT